MDFLDDLDKAFEDMLSFDGPQEAEDPTAHPVDFSMDELRGQLAHEHLAPVVSLVADAAKLQRRYLIAALVGGIEHLLDVDPNPETRDLALAIARTLKTSRGHRRKILGRNHKAELDALVARFLASFNDTSDHEASGLVIRLQAARMDLEVVYTLFRNGISCPHMLHQAPAHEIAHITHLDDATIAAIKALLPLAKN